MRKITRELFDEEPQRYIIKDGKQPEAPNCPYGNKYEWIGFDQKEKEYVRFTKSVFKTLIQSLEK